MITPKKVALSERRAYVVETLVPWIVPSRLGDGRFDIISRGVTPSHPTVTALLAQGKKYTTCGHLTGHIGLMLGDNGLLKAGATNGLRTAAIGKNAWLVPDGTNRPLPGDLYALNNRGVTDRNAGISHVGVIIEIRGNQWITADAGQGGGFAADYLTRNYDAAKGTLTGETLKKPIDRRPPRLLAGWLDLDAYFTESWVKDHSSESSNHNVTGHGPRHGPRP